jgi:hypothetical protein
MAGAEVEESRASSRVAYRLAGERRRGQAHAEIGGRAALIEDNDLERRERLLRVRGREERESQPRRERGAERAAGQPQILRRM